MAATRLTRAHRLLIGVVVTGAVVIAAIGFAGSYSAVRDLAEQKGFGDFAPYFPIGIDAGIVVLLALDLLLTWIRIPFPLLRHTAWLLTAATIAFNGATAWPDPLGVGMHAVIPVLFVVAVEAARHAIGRIADITADKHMEGVRLSRWLLAFPSTFRLWRRMKLWELRSYEEVIKFEQDRLVYRARLRARYGRAWRRKAPVEAVMPLRLARYGVPLSHTAPAGLAAAGIHPPALPAATPDPLRATHPAVPSGTASETAPAAPSDPRAATATDDGTEHARPSPAAPHPAGEPHPTTPATDTAQAAHPPHHTQPAAPPAKTAPTDEAVAEAPTSGPDTPHPPSPASGPPQSSPHREPAPAPAHPAATRTARPQVTVPVTPRRHRALGDAGARARALPRQRGDDTTPWTSDPQPDAHPVAPEAPDTAPAAHEEPYPDGLDETSHPRLNAPDATSAPRQGHTTAPHAPDPTAPTSDITDAPPPSPLDDEGPQVPIQGSEAVPVTDEAEAYYRAYRQYVADHSAFPNARQLSRTLNDRYGIRNPDDSLLSETHLRTFLREFRDRYHAEMGTGG